MNFINSQIYNSNCNTTRSRCCELDNEHVFGKQFFHGHNSCLYKSCIWEKLVNMYSTPYISLCFQTYY